MTEKSDISTLMYFRSMRRNFHLNDFEVVLMGFSAWTITIQSLWRCWELKWWSWSFVFIDLGISRDCDCGDHRKWGSTKDWSFLEGTRNAHDTFLDWLKNQLQPLEFNVSTSSEFTIAGQTSSRRSDGICHTASRLVNNGIIINSTISNSNPKFLPCSAAGTEDPIGDNWINYRENGVDRI